MSDDGTKNSEAAKASQRLACANCGKLAFALLNDYPVCLDCKYKNDMSQWMEFTKHAAMLNLAAEEIDAIMPFGPQSPTIKIPRAPMPPFSYNNQTVSVSGGNVGSINFGTVRDIQINLQSLTEAGAPDIVELLTKLTDAILNAQDADETAKNDLLEQVATLTELANAKPEERKPGIVKALFSAVKDGASAIASVAGAWTSVSPLLRGHFGL